MRSKGAGGGGGHDVEAALDELYATPPPGFVARREVLAARARTAGRAEDSRRIHAARRPSLAAWAANLLLRSRPEESGRFLELGRALREAYRSLDAGGIKELSDQRRGLVAALSRQAGELAREAGHRLSDTVQRDVETTLLAVLTDQDAADLWATGRLESALVPPTDFPSSSAAADGTPRAAATARKPPRAAATPSPQRTRTKDEVAERRRQKRERLVRARETARAADRRLRELRAAQADAEALLKQARDRHDRAAQQVSAAERQLHQAREELQRADQEQNKAEEQRRRTADATAQAERTAHEAAQEVKRLS
ncbi:hypothetical protein [Streptomyces sp. NPDC012510]|uniref:hypothetical protein n=1 Tax=Streptomyces sp. NPDC012510 TaxID=3364838 RepID=UPI0036EC6E1E